MTTINRFQRWSQIDMDKPDTMPPLRENILLFSAISGARGWAFFKNQAHRVSTMRRYMYTHFREETTIDTP